MGQNKVLITGIDGFIGSHLAEYLIDKGVSVSGIVLDKSKAERLNGLGPLQLYEADVRDLSGISSIIGEINPNHIIHLAAALKNKGSLPEEIRHTLDINVNGTVNLLEASKDLDLESFIFSSTLEVNGNNGIPFTEMQKENPITPYSLSKFFAEKYCRYYHEVFNVPVKIARLSLVYGKSQEPVMFIPFAVQHILNGKKLTLYSDGLQTRDFLYIDDAVEALWSLAQFNAAKGKIVNICSGEETNLRRIVEIIEHILGMKADLDFNKQNYREQEIMRYVGDNHFAKALIGWTPKHSLEEGLKLMISGYKP